MRPLPRSLYGRLLLLSAVATLLALGVAGVGIAHVLEGFVTRSFDRQLDDKLLALSFAVRPDGTIDPARIDLFDRMLHTGEDWRVDAPHGHAATADIAGSVGISYADGAHLPPAASYIWRTPGLERRLDRRPFPLPEDVPGSTGSAPFDLRTTDGHLVHGRWRSVDTTAGRATVALAVPRVLIVRPIRGAMAPLMLSLLLLGVALALATLVQLRIGLRPLAKMRESLAAIRAGAAEALPDGQPTELAPLAAEINALLGENAAALANARGHVANLAHGLKTPLATLALALPPHDPDGALRAHVARIEHAVRHHLGRARAATPGGGLRVATPLAPVVADLTDALARIHAERGIVVRVALDPALAVAVDPQDLDELLGNLLDNAWRWARATVAVAARVEDARVHLAIADDGPGIAPAARAAALAPGGRLDEAGDGHGFGLSIARELAELYGGALTLGTATSGGLLATVALPRAGVRR